MSVGAACLFTYVDFSIFMFHLCLCRLLGSDAMHTGDKEEARSSLILKITEILHFIVHLDRQEYLIDSFNNYC